MPLRRYDLTGYGATTFSEWTDTNPRPPTFSRPTSTSSSAAPAREIIQVQSIICPWAIKVVRTITIDRLCSGAVERYDSGWQPASDGLFEYPDGTSITRNQIHSGLIDGAHQRQQHPAARVSPVHASGHRGRHATHKESRSTCSQSLSTPNVIIQPQHTVTQGGANQHDLNGDAHVCVAVHRHHRLYRTDLRFITST